METRSADATVRIVCRASIYTDNYLPHPPQHRLSASCPGASVAGNGEGSVPQSSVTDIIGVALFNWINAPCPVPLCQVTDFKGEPQSLKALLLLFASSWKIKLIMLMVKYSVPGETYKWLNIWSGVCRS